MKRLAALAAAAVLLAGCEKGCLSTKLEEMSNAKGAPNGTGKGSIPLRGVDCPDGLARCAGGMVQASRLYSYATPCNGTPDECSCPWDNVAGCDRGCVVEQAEVVMAKDKAALQLCTPTAADVLSKAPPRIFAFAAMVCDSPSYRCSEGVVVRCGEGPSKAVATCVRGCADDDTVIDDDGVTGDQAVAVLCLHAPDEAAASVPATKKPPARN